MIMIDAEYSVDGRLVRLGIPRPPNLVGDASSRLSKSLVGGLPVRFGISFDLIVSSRGCMN